MEAAEIMAKASMMETDLLLHRNFIFDRYMLNFSGRRIVGVGRMFQITPLIFSMC